MKYDLCMKKKCKNCIYETKCFENKQKEKRNRKDKRNRSKFRKSSGGG